MGPRFGACLRRPVRVVHFGPLPLPALRPAFFFIGSAEEVGDALLSTDESVGFRADPL